MKCNTYILLILLVLASLDGCKKDDNPILPPSTTKPGKRDYTFTIDTLAYPGSYQIMMEGMWASSASDIYVVGHNDQNRAQMYHYNGSAWSPVRLASSDGGAIGGSFDLYAVHGVAKNCIWAVGERYYSSSHARKIAYADSSLTLLFDGHAWTEVPAHGGHALYSVWVVSTQEAWAGGMDGSLFHMKSGQWNKYDLSVDHLFTSIAGLSASNIFAIGVGQHNSPQYSYLYKFNGIAWKLVDSTTHSSPRFGGGVRVGSGALYSCGPNIYRFQSGVWHKLYEGSLAWLSQTNQNNIIAAGNIVVHYNGVDWKEFKELQITSGFIRSGCYTDGNEIFILEFNDRITRIIHGR